METTEMTAEAQALASLLPATDPQFRAQGYSLLDEFKYIDYLAESEALYELEQATGMVECPRCHEWSCVVGTACTLGYPGHPGAEFSATYECINPECQHAEVA